MRINRLGHSNGEGRKDAKIGRNVDILRLTKRLTRSTVFFSIIQPMNARGSIGGRPLSIPGGTDAPKCVHFSEPRSAPDTCPSDGVHFRSGGWGVYCAKRCSLFRKMASPRHLTIGESPLSTAFHSARVRNPIPRFAGGPCGMDCAIR